MTATGSAPAQPLSTAMSSERLVGVLVVGGVECPLLQTDSGAQFALQGVLPQQYPVGTRLVVEGVWLRYSKCMQTARTLQVNQVLNVEPSS